jgi:hypothetical protein
MTDSASAILDSHSAVSDRSALEPQYPANNLECIKDDNDGELDSDDDNEDSESSISSSEDNTSHNVTEFAPLFEPGSEPPETLKIPSIVITPVVPNAKLPGTEASPTYSTLLNSDNRDLPYDSGKGSSEITTFTCQTNNFSNNTKTPSQSSSSLSTNSSGVFSDLHSKPGVYVNGGFVPSVPRKTRSKSEDQGRGSSPSWKIGNKGFGNGRISRSLTDLEFRGSPCKYRCLSEGKLNSLDYNDDNNKKVEGFSIHTKVFDDMMKS